MHVCVCVPACVHACMHACVCVCLCVCVHAHTNELSTIHNTWLSRGSFFVFDMCNRWFAFVQIMSWMRLLLRKYALELESKKDAGGMGHAMVPTPAFRTSSFVLPMRVCLPPPASSFPSCLSSPIVERAVCWGCPCLALSPSQCVMCGEGGHQWVLWPVSHVCCIPGGGFGRRIIKVPFR